MTFARGLFAYWYLLLNINQYLWRFIFLFILLLLTIFITHKFLVKIQLGYNLNIKVEFTMNKNNVIDLNSLNVDELRAITENAQQLIEEKQHQRLYDAYMQFEKIAEESDASIEEILQAGEKLEKKRSIKYRNTDNNEETWTGRGRKPTWLVDALATGRKLEDFAI